MGDVAILLKSRFSEWETILSNGIVNLISLLGVLMGLYSNDLSPETKQYALVFVAGNFIYIASDIWKNLFRHTSLWVNALEMVGLLLGVALTL
jgi:zinc transporter ZupT